MIISGATNRNDHSPITSVTLRRKSTMQQNNHTTYPISNSNNMGTQNMSTAMRDITRDVGRLALNIGVGGLVGGGAGVNNNGSHRQYTQVYNST